jgi:tRNA (adenine57-N1/adenine58-N1)-methyltransferase
VGETGEVSSYERREEFADVARRNVGRFFGDEPANWRLTVGDLEMSCDDEDVDRVVLDMLAPWDVLDTVAKAMLPGGVLCAYVATTTQLSRVVESMREHGAFTEPKSFETLVRGWHVDGLAVRPDHRMIGHTGFLVTTRRMAPGVLAPPRRRRPAKGSRPDMPMQG